MLQSPAPHLVQASLKVGPVDDAHEREADAVADQVVQRLPMSGAAPAGISEGAAGIQRKCAACEEEEEGQVQRKPMPQIQAKGGPLGGIAAPQGFGQQMGQSQGMPLDRNVRRQMEGGFGRDFGGVRIHTGAQAAQLSGQISARAFTHGQDIFFNQGEYQPGTRQGQHLLAHELTHTVQQGAGGRGIQRAWAPRGSNCPDVPATQHITSIVVSQEFPQMVTINWDNGTTETSITSTGKGQCCVTANDQTPCDGPRSRTTGSNCTPITDGTPLRIVDRFRNFAGFPFWSSFHRARGIGLHGHPDVTGEPLSHGCVRLPEDFARRIFCGVQQNVTEVIVQGFPRPRCDSTDVQLEWQGDAFTATSPARTDEERRQRTEARRTLREAFQVPERDVTARATALMRDASLVPRCVTTAAQSVPAGATPEERRLYTNQFDVGSFQQGTAPTIVNFIAGLRGAADLAAARTLVTTTAQGLWNSATAQAAAAPSGQLDDRPLYWTRLRLVSELRSFTPTFPITTAERQGLIDTMDSVSRGHATVGFGAATAGQKRILISGYDPFGFDQPLTATSGDNRTIRDSNPSGAAVLALHGQTVTGANNLSALIQGVLFPVRYRDFDAGMIENLFRPFLTGPNPASMIMTISQGGGGFHIEQNAGRNRTTDTLADNEGVFTPGSPSNPFTPANMLPGAEHVPTALPHAEMTNIPNAQSTGPMRTELRTTGDSSTPGPNPRAISGTGGGFLSNEIFYRVRNLQISLGSGSANIRVGHLHVPNEDELTREQIRDRIREIIVASLPALP